MMTAPSKQLPKNSATPHSRDLPASMMRFWMIGRRRSGVKVVASAPSICLMPPAGFLSSVCAARICPKGSGCVSSVSKLSIRWRIVDFGWTLLRIRPSKIRNSTAVTERTNSSFSIVSFLSQIVV